MDEPRARPEPAFPFGPGRERKGALGTAGVLRAQVGTVGVGEGVLGEEPHWGREQGAGVEPGRERQGFPSSN